jgi:hypothetical protein
LGGLTIKSNGGGRMKKEIISMQEAIEIIREVLDTCQAQDLQNILEKGLYIDDYEVRTD